MRFNLLSMVRVQRTPNSLLVFSFAACVALGFVDHSVAQDTASSPNHGPAPDLSGQWDIQEEDKSYQATLDSRGNGPYTWQGGRITTIEVADRKWTGKWEQPGNDREGGFELLLSEDATEATGVWWYTRVGDRKNIPPRQWGGRYTWKRLSSESRSTADPPA